MKKHILYLAIGMLAAYLPSFLAAQDSFDGNNRWDLTIIGEANIWHNLLVNYSSADRRVHWDERKQALEKVIFEFPDSQWADDAKLLLAGEQAVINNDLNGAIADLRKIMGKYPLERTIVDGWNFNRGCLINEMWLMWAPGLVVLNEDFSVRISFPFDKDNKISLIENEILTYFNHKNKHPQLTKDVAQFTIALMLRQKGDVNGAKFELEELLSRYPDFSMITIPDYNASKHASGHLIEFEPPLDMTPVWRVQYSAIVLLLQLYSLPSDIDKYLKLSSKVATECSRTGWNWNLNKLLGDLHAKNNFGKLALEQYNTSLNGIKSKTGTQTARMKDLFDNEYAIKPKNFISWDNEISNQFSKIVFQIEFLINNIE